MAYPEPNKFVPQSFKQVQKEYLETPFWISSFGPGTQITVVEDLPTTKPFRYRLVPSNKGGPAYPENLIKISDGFTQKDLSISKTNTQKLLINIPDSINNLKGVTLANDSGRWVFVCQTDESSSANFPNLISQPQRLHDQKSQFIQKMLGSMKALESVGVPCDIAKLTKMCEAISPGNALALISDAKGQGFIIEDKGIYRVID